MGDRLDGRVRAVAEQAVRKRGTVAPLDVLTGLGWLSTRAVETWRQGRADTLAELAAVPADRLAEAVDHLGAWARGQGLAPAEATYLAATPARPVLRFTAGEDSAMRVHWTDPSLSPARLARIAAREREVPDPVAVWAEKRWYCALCRETGDFHFVEDDHPVCLDCADMAHLVFLPSGDTALTRRARRASGLAAIVVRWQTSRKRYVRRGVLVEWRALESAEDQCLADEDVRERRKARDRERRAARDVVFQGAFAARIGELFPGLPAERARAIAEHAGTRSSGRVGRSAAGQALDEGAVTLAVVAAIRHEETDYDALLMAGVPRAQARERIRADVDRVLARWRYATSSGAAEKVSQAAVEPPS